MLKSIDTLLGVSLVMLVASMGVTVLTQIWTTMLNTRGRHLRDGLAALIHQLAPGLTSTCACQVAGHILRHPLVANGKRLGSLIHREEFTRLLSEAAAGEGPRRIPEPARHILANALKASGTGTSSTDFLAKANSWFEPAIERVSLRFTASTHKTTLAAAFVFTFAMQLDAVALINRLSTDDSLRTELVGQAAAQHTLPAGSLSEIEELAGGKVLPVPRSAAEWSSQWTPSRLPGMLLSVLLLSLGAPFWFEVLKDLLRLRSTVAPRDGEQRAEGFDLAGPDLLKEKADLQLGEAAHKCL